MNLCVCSRSAEINTTPGENFYQHINRRWMEDPANAIPDDQITWGGFSILRDESVKNQITIIKELMNIPYNELNTDQQKVVTIWKACVANETAGSGGRDG